MKNKLYLDLRGTPVAPIYMTLSHGHGYHAYLEVTNGLDTFMYKLLTGLSMWNGRINTYELTNGSTYADYELDCRNLQFLRSPAFVKMAKSCGFDVIFCDDNCPNLIRYEFWEKLKR